MNSSQHLTSQPSFPAHTPVSSSSPQNFHDLTVEGSTSDLPDLGEVFDAINELILNPTTASCSCADGSLELPPPVRFFRRRGRTSKAAIQDTDTKGTVTSTGSACFMKSDLRALRNRIIGHDLHQSESRSEAKTESSGDDFGTGRDRPEGTTSISGMGKDKPRSIPFAVGTDSGQPVSL